MNWVLTGGRHADPVAWCKVSDSLLPGLASRGVATWVRRMDLGRGRLGQNGPPAGGGGCDRWALAWEMRYLPGGRAQTRRPARQSEADRVVP